MAASGSADEVPAASVKLLTLGNSGEFPGVGAARVCSALSGGKPRSSSCASWGSKLAALAHPYALVLRGGVPLPWVPASEA